MPQHFYIGLYSRVGIAHPTSFHHLLFCPQGYVMPLWYTLLSISQNIRKLIRMTTNLVLIAPFEQPTQD
jgi:hypothetical protein